MAGTELDIYVLYKNPSDYRGKWVVRLWHNDVPEIEPLCVCDDMADALKYIPEGLIHLPRQAGEDACIVASFF